MEQRRLVPVHFIWKGQDEEDKVHKEEEKKGGSSKSKGKFFSSGYKSTNLTWTKPKQEYGGTLLEENILSFSCCSLWRTAADISHIEKGIGNKPVAFYKRSNVRGEERFLFLLGPVWWEDSARLRTGAWRQLVMEHVMSEPRRMHFTRFFFLFFYYYCAHRGDL